MKITITRQKAERIIAELTKAIYSQTVELREQLNDFVVSKFDFSEPIDIFDDYFNQEFTEKIYDDIISKNYEISICGYEICKIKGNLIIVYKAPYEGEIEAITRYKPKKEEVTTIETMINAIEEEKFDVEIEL